MPFKFRLRRGKKYKVSTKNSYVVCVHLLDNALIECTLNADSIGHECLANVCQRIELCETEYFGLRYLNKNLQLRWVDLEKPLKKQLDKYASTPMLYFGVMFYVTEAHLLQDEMTRYQFFLQLKTDVIDGKLPCPQDQAVLLASYSVQAEFGDHDELRHTQEVLKDFVLLPRSMTADDRTLAELTSEVANTHRSLQGTSQAAAEIQYIMLAQQLDGYGLEYYPAKESSGNELLIGVSFEGIFVKHLNGQPTEYFKWADVTSLSHNKRMFGIDSSLIDKSMLFQMDNPDLAKYVWRMCSLQHGFDRGKSKISSKDQDTITDPSPGASGPLSDLQQSVLTTEQNKTQETPEVSTQYNNGTNEITEVHQSTTIDHQVAPQYVYDQQNQIQQNTEPVYANGSIMNLAQAETSQYQQQQQQQAVQQAAQPTVTASNSFSGQSAVLPQYRATPDYETVMRQRMERLAQQQQQQQQSLHQHHHVQGITNIGSAQVYMQPETMAYSQPEIRHTHNLTNHLTDTAFNFRQLDGSSICHNLLREAGLTQQVSYRQHVPHRPVDRTSSLIIHPTYSTPELHLNHLPNHFSTSEQMISEAAVHHYKPPPPYPRNSSSTPDLATQTARAQASSSPDLVPQRNLAQVNSGSSPHVHLDRSLENLPHIMQDLQLHGQMLSQSQASQSYLLSQPPPYGAHTSRSNMALSQPMNQHNVVYNPQTQLPVGHTITHSVPANNVMMNLTSPNVYNSPPSSPSNKALTSQPDIIHHQVALQAHDTNHIVPNDNIGSMPNSHLSHRETLENHLQLYAAQKQGLTHLAQVPYRTVHTANSSHSSGGGSDSLSLPVNAQISMASAGMDSLGYPEQDPNTRNLKPRTEGSRTLQKPVSFSHGLVAKPVVRPVTKSASLQEPISPMLKPSPPYPHAKTNSAETPSPKKIPEKQLDQPNTPTVPVSQPTVSSSSSSPPHTAAEMVVRRRQKVDQNKELEEDRGSRRLSVGPLRLAAMNGLILTGADVLEDIQPESRAPRDDRRRQLENKMEEGQILREFEQIPKKRSKAECTVAASPENQERNRFKDVCPYDDNRVNISSTKENPHGYINASSIKVKVANDEQWYVATQGPLATTLVDFWEMVWEQDIEVIAMLTALEEQGREKCHRYWPERPGVKNRIRLGPFQITTQFNHDSGPYVTRGLTVKHVPANKERMVWHLQYTDWPDHGCPEDIHGFLAFLNEIDSVRRHAQQERGDDRRTPVVVHCSAGVGRSGVVILTETMKACLEHNQDADIPKTLQHLREQRMHLVQTVAQYTFVYQTLIQYLKNSRLI